MLDQRAFARSVHRLLASLDMASESEADADEAEESTDENSPPDDADDAEEGSDTLADDEPGA